MHEIALSVTCSCRSLTSCWVLLITHINPQFILPVKRIQTKWIPSRKVWILMKLGGFLAQNRKRGYRWRIGLVDKTKFSRACRYANVQAVNDKTDRCNEALLVFQSSFYSWICPTGRTSHGIGEGDDFFISLCWLILCCRHCFDWTDSFHSLIDYPGVLFFCLSSQLVTACFLQFWSDPEPWHGLNFCISHPNWSVWKIGETALRWCWQEIPETKRWMSVGKLLQDLKSAGRGRKFCSSDRKYAGTIEWTLIEQSAVFSTSRA